MTQSGPFHHHPKFQYGGRKTGICKIFKKNPDTRRCISAHRRDINEILMALPKLWVQLSNEMNRITVQLDRKWKNARWRPKNFDCVYLRFQTGQPTRCIRNSNSLTHVFEVQHSTGTYGKTAKKPEVEKSKMAASKLRMHASLLPDKISTKFQRLCLRF